jgi:hypothetical protein
MAIASDHTLRYWAIIAGFEDRALPLLAIVRALNVVDD